jgi:hypothetical protein
MFRRFVSGSAIASIAIAFAVLVLLLVHGLAAQRFFSLIAMWCSAPLVWGLWAMIAPSSWLPQRLPLWGAILGLLAGFNAFVVLNLPLRVLGVTAPVILRGVGVVLIVVLYYLLWMLVRLAFRSLGTLTPVA